MNLVTKASLLALPLFIALVLVYGLAKKVDVYESFVKGAKSGAGLVFRILPYIVGMIFAVDIFKVSGAFDYLAQALSAVTSAVGIPPEVLPIAILRPFSGGASLGMLAGVLAQYGADSFVGRVASTFMGSSETLFYTVSLYFGSVGVTKTRYVIPVALITDAFGLVFSCVICKLVFG